MRARITLRAVGLIPLDNKEREEQLIRDEVNNILSKKRKGKNITIDQVLKAFARGDEVRVMFPSLTFIYLTLSNLGREHHPHDMRQLRPRLCERHGCPVQRLSDHGRYCRG